MLPGPRRVISGFLESFYNCLREKKKKVEKVRVFSPKNHIWGHSHIFNIFDIFAYFWFDWIEPNFRSRIATGSIGGSNESLILICKNIKKLIFEISGNFLEISRKFPGNPGEKFKKKVKIILALIFFYGHRSLQNC